MWGADLATFGIKQAVGRQRPFAVELDPEPLVIARVGESFPSGHAATAFAGAAVLVRYLPRRWAVLLTLATAIAFSRIYVGVHYPADVLAGAIFGTVFATALLRLAAALRRSPPGPPAG